MEEKCPSCQWDWIFRDTAYQQSDGRASEWFFRTDSGSPEPEVFFCPQCGRKLPQEGGPVEEIDESILEHPAVRQELELHRRALCTLVALITGQPIMTDALQALLKELGHVPVSPLLVPGAVVGKPS